MKMSAVESPYKSPKTKRRPPILRIKQEVPSQAEHAQILDRLRRIPRAEETPSLFQMTETQPAPKVVLQPLINIKDSKLFVMPRKPAEGALSQAQFKSLLKMVSSKKIIQVPPPP